MLIVSIAIWGKAISADAAAKRILDNKILSKTEILEAVNSWPAPKTTELIGTYIVPQDKNCNISNDLANNLLKIDIRNSQAWYFKAICFNFQRKLKRLNKN